MGRRSLRRVACPLVVASAAVVAGAGRADAAGPSVHALYVGAAESGIAQVHQVWWNPIARWFTTYPWSQQDGAGGLATAWDVTPVVETYATLALADPTAANVSAAEAVARGTEAYWDPAVPPRGGYAFLPHKTEAMNAFFDDSGWLGLAFVDAYRATHDRRFLADAERAFHFIATQGWDRVAGGVWWDTAHEKKTAEPLAAEVLLGARLYEATRDRRFLAVVRTFTRWADRHAWNANRHLYQRNATDDTVMNYVQGMMIAGDAVLCQALPRTSYCRRAEQLAAAAAVAFPPTYHWAPECDAIYLSGLLELWTVTRHRRWYALADQQGRLALENARDATGLFTNNWDGSFASNRRILTHAGTLLLLSSLAAAPAP